MTNMNWRLFLHTTDGSQITYTLSGFEWRGDKRVGTGLSVMSTCRPSELPAVLDGIADHVLHSYPFQLELPGL